MTCLQAHDPQFVNKCFDCHRCKHLPGQDTYRFHEQLFSGTLISLFVAKIIKNCNIVK